MLKQKYSGSSHEGVQICDVFVKCNCIQELFLGKEKVSLFERCPHFSGVLRERFHCILHKWPHACMMYVQVLFMVRSYIYHTHSRVCVL